MKRDSGGHDSRSCVLRRYLKSVLPLRIELITKIGQLLQVGSNIDMSDFDWMSANGLPLEPKLQLPANAMTGTPPSRIISHLDLDASIHCLAAK